MQNPHTTTLTEADRLARALDRALDLSVPLARLEDLIDRTEALADMMEQAADKAAAVARDLKAQVASAQNHVGEIFALLDDGRLSEEGDR